jgi:ATP-dependent DNA helicase RecQ
MESPSKLKVVMHPSKLYEWRMEHPKNDEILEIILRSYPGIFTDAKHINEDKIAILAHSTRDVVYAHLVWLHRVGIVTYVPFKRTPLLIYNTDRKDAESLYIPPVAYENRIERMYARLVSIYEYATKEECRSVILARYFGQTDAQPCGHCDVCIANKK